MGRRIAVIAGTRIDTQMGVDYISRKNREMQEAFEKGYCADGLPGDGPDAADARSSIYADSQPALLEPVYCPVAEDCDAQIKFQYSDAGSRRRRIDEVFDPEIAKGTRDFFIYCNSLSGAFDFDTYAIEKTYELISLPVNEGADLDDARNNARSSRIGSAANERTGSGRAESECEADEQGCMSGDEIRIYTPLQIYRELGSRFRRVGVMAAHNLSAHSIEQALMSSNEDLYVIGTGNMSIVRAIEDGIPPDEIISKCGLRYMMQYMEACGVEAVILGCTHFPYIKQELSACAGVPLIDPSDLMYSAVLSR